MVHIVHTWLAALQRCRRPAKGWSRRPPRCRCRGGCGSAGVRCNKPDIVLEGGCSIVMCGGPLRNPNPKPQMHSKYRSTSEALRRKQERGTGVSTTVSQYNGIMEIIVGEGSKRIMERDKVKGMQLKRELEEITKRGNGKGEGGQKRGRRSGAFPKSPRPPIPFPPPKT